MSVGIDTTHGPTARKRCHLCWSIGLLAVYVAIAALATRPLLELSSTHIAGDPGDPVLNASILWWNSIVVPFSPAWWNPPYFHLAHGVSAFTENLVGISPIATPIYWLTRNPLTAYNLSLFLTWPLSAFAVFLLVRFLAQRNDAAFVAGLAFGFTPYRTAEFGHIQMVASFWMPLTLLGLHGYLKDGRMAWLVLFGIAWLLQSLANGYLMFYGAVLIGIWILYFCSTREAWPRLRAIGVAWVVASLPLVPVLLKYRAIHDYYGLRRDLSNTVSYSTPIRGWWESTDFIWLWRHFLPDGDDDLFPGATAIVLVLVAGFLALRRYRSSSTALHPRLARLLKAGTIIFLIPVAYTLVYGPWRADISGIVLRISDIDRALTAALLCAAPLVYWSPWIRDALARRSVFFFYALTTIVMAMFAFGPVIPHGQAVVFDYAPYHWLMYLPGIQELRVPSRFWMLGVLCLSVAAGLAYARLPVTRRASAYALLVVTSVGLLLDGWIRAVPMAEAPQQRPRVERRDLRLPILELPFGAEWDAAATYRSIWHRRGVFNGASGHDPKHHFPLLEGLNDRDPRILRALATFGAFDVVVDRSSRLGLEMNAYVAAFPDATRITEDGALTLYRVAAASQDVALGPALPIEVARATGGNPGLCLDGRSDTFWDTGPQKPGQSIEFDLGAEREVAGITHSLGPYAPEFPRHLVIDVSTDGVTWQPVWEGRTVSDAFRAAVVAPRNAVMRFAFPPQRARAVRLRQLATHGLHWRLAEFSVHGPAVTAKP